MYKKRAYIYLDHAATTIIDPEVAQLILDCSQNYFGNPSSIHGLGRQAKTVIEKSRRTIAQLLNASIGEIFFTSGGTESNNMVLKAMPTLGIKKLLTTKGEHPSIINYIDHNDIEVQYIDVDHLGRINIDHLEDLLSSTDEKCMVSIIHGHNEIGTVNNLALISQLCQKHNALLHSDTVQTMGHRKIDVQAIKIDFLSSSGHKYHGPRGVGFVYINSKNLIDPYFWGGAQERNMRAGTEPTALIAGIALALEKRHQSLEETQQKLYDLKTYFIEQLKNNFSDIQFNGDIEGDHLAHILNVSFPLTPKTEMLIMSLDMVGICASGGSACSSGVEHASAILNEIKMPTNRKAIRFSFSTSTTSSEIDYCIENIKTILEIKG